MVEVFVDKWGMIWLGFVEVFGKIGKFIIFFLLKVLVNYFNFVVRCLVGKGLV